MILFIGSSVANSAPFGPIRRLAKRLLFDDLLVVLDALAVERRREQLAAAAVFGSVEREDRTRAEDPAEVGLDVDQVVGAREEDLPRQRGVGDDHAAAEERNVDGEDGAVTLRRSRAENHRRNPASRTLWTGFGSRTTGGILPGVVGAFGVDASLRVSVIVNHSQPVPWYYDVP